MDPSKDNIEMHVSSEPLPEAIQNFQRNHPDTRFDNLYLCESVDRNGNIVDTKIGVNLVTNYGLSKCHTANTSNPYWERGNIYLGSGKTEPSYDKSSLTSYISALGNGNGDGFSVTYYPTKYDRNTHIWSCRYEICTGMWDYTAGENKEYEIWEIGVGYSTTQLYTHALIYDEDGNQTCIKKKPDTRLYITVYLIANINTKRIQERYTEGKYVLISPQFVMQYGNSNSLTLARLTRRELYNSSGIRFMNSYYTLRTYQGSLKENDPQQSHWSLAQPQWLFEDKYQYCGGFLLSTNSRYANTTDYLNEHIDTNPFGIITYDKMIEPEEIECYNVYTNQSNMLISPATADDVNNPSMYLLTDIMGARRRYKPESGQNWDWNAGIPCVDFNMTEVNMYNHLTKEYDIQVPFHSSNWDYNEAHNRVYLSLWVSHNGVAKKVYVYVNPFADSRTISQFNNSSMVLCATDEYWDPETYVQISNLSSVPDDLAHKRYYIVTSGTNTPLNPIYMNPDYHKIIPSKKAFELTDDVHGVPILKRYDSYDKPNFLNPNVYTRGACRPLCNDVKKWYASFGHVVFYNKEADSCTVKPITMRDGYIGCKYRRFATKDGDKLVVFENKINTYSQCVKNTLRIFTITNAETDLSTQDVELQFEDQTDMDDLKMWHYYTWTDNGFLVAQRYSYEYPHEAVILDVYGDEESDGQATQHLLKGVFACTAILLTDNCFYMDTNESHDSKYVFKLYDMKNRTVINTYEYDDGGTYEIGAVYGFREFVYITLTRDSVNTTLHINTETNSIEMLPTSWFGTRFDRWDSFTKIAAVDECLIVCSSNNDAIPLMIRSSNPNPSSFEKLFDANSVYSASVFTSSGLPHIGTCNDGKQLILTLINGYELKVVDLGLAVDTGPLKQYPYNRHTLYSNRYNVLGNYTNEIAFMCAYVFDDGIIFSAESYKDETYFWNGRQYWMPIEQLIPLHIKGTTRTLSAWNQPIRFWGKETSFDVTNDISRLIDDEDKSQTVASDSADNVEVTNSG